RPGGFAAVGGGFCVLDATGMRLLFLDAEGRTEDVVDLPGTMRPAPKALTYDATREVLLLLAPGRLHGLDRRGEEVAAYPLTLARPFEDLTCDPETGQIVLVTSSGE